MSAWVVIATRPTDRRPVKDMAAFVANGMKFIWTPVDSAPYTLAEAHYLVECGLMIMHHRLSADEGSWECIVRLSKAGEIEAAKPKPLEPTGRRALRPVPIRQGHRVMASVR